MKIACIGGGVAALYFGIAMKRLQPSWPVDILERDSEERNAGWGIILREPMLAAMRELDAVSHAALLERSVSWDQIAIGHRGETVLLSSQFGRSTGRHALVEVLRARAAELGCRIVYGAAADADSLADYYDLLAGADGVRSSSRARVAAGNIERVPSANRFIWLGCNRAVQRMEFDFQQTPYGPVWVHAYPFSTGMSTFVVECGQQTFDGFGFGRHPLAHDIATLENIFSNLLEGAELRSLSASPREWRQFEQIRCGTLHRERLVLIGDAAHTAHFSIGSGTRLAVEDAIALASSLHAASALPGGWRANLSGALAHYQQQRQDGVAAIQQQALHSMRWFDNIATHYALPPALFARAFLFRSLGPLGRSTGIPEPLPT